MPADDPVPQWHRLRNAVLRRRTERLVGAPSDGEEHPELRFTVTQLPPPGSGITVTMDGACDLADVYDLCGQVAAACLDDDRRVSFNRAGFEGRRT